MNEFEDMVYADLDNKGLEGSYRLDNPLESKFPRSTMKNPTRSKQEAYVNQESITLILVGLPFPYTWHPDAPSNGLDVNTKGHHTVRS